MYTPNLNPDNLIALNVTNHILNKDITTTELRWSPSEQAMSNRWVLSSGFHQVNWLPMQIFNHLMRGFAITASAMKGRRLKANFITCQLLGLDCDFRSIAQVLQHPEIRKIATFVYSTASATPENPRCRILCITNSPFMDAQTWELAAQGFIDRYPDLMPDKACKDTSRIWYGSTNRTETPQVFLDNIMPDSFVKELVDERKRKLEAERQHHESRPRVTITGNRASRLMDWRFNSTILKIESAPKGERHIQTMKGGFWLFGHPKGGWQITDDEIERGIYNACLKNGAVADYGEREILRWIQDAKNAATPVSTEIEDTPNRTPPPKKNSPARLTGGIETFVEYRDEKPIVHKRSFALIVPCPEMQKELRSQGYPALYLDNDEERVKQIRYIVNRAVPNTLVIASSEQGHQIVQQLGVGRVVVPGDDLGKQLKDTYHLSPIL